MIHDCHSIQYLKLNQVYKLNKYTIMHRTELHLYFTNSLYHLSSISTAIKFHCTNARQTTIKKTASCVITILFDKAWPWASLDENGSQTCQSVISKE
uniref:Uncharacterized protein n=1 Tax=Anguilla anguilla TaxID=7936 RepID=A0A0E9XME9_ANGAN